MLITCSDPKLIQQCKDEMQKVFEMEVKQSTNGIFIWQQKYTHDIFKKFNVEEYKHMGTPILTIEKLSNVLMLRKLVFHW